MSALKAVKREQRKLRELRKKQRQHTKKQQQYMTQPMKKDRAFGSTFVREDSSDDENEKRVKKRKNKNKESLWATRKESLVHLVYSLIRAVNPSKLHHGTSSLPGIACLLQMSQSDSESIKSGPSTHIELLSLAWGCINKSLTLPGFTEGGGRGKGHMVNGPDCQRLLQAIFGISTRHKSSATGSDNASHFTSSSLNDDTNFDNSTGSVVNSSSFLRDPTLVNPTVSVLVYPDVEVVVLSSLIVLRCVCRVEFTGAALEALAIALRTDDGKKCFIENHGMNAIIPMLGSVNIKRRGHPALLSSMVAVLLSVVRDGKHLNDFLKSIVHSEPFFGAASRAFRLNPSGNMHNQIMKLPDLQVIEALSMVLERLSRFHSNKSHSMFIQGTI
jgi:hypothetical protein